PPWRTIRFGAQGQPIGAVYRRADTAGAAGRTSAGTATSYRQPWPRRTAPSGGRACGRTRAQVRLPWNQSARTYRAAAPGRRCRGATNCSILLAVETVVASARAGNHPRPLGYREPAALGPRRRLRRGPRPQPQGPRTGEPRHSAQAGTQHSPLASEHRVHTPQNQTRRVGRCLPHLYARPNAIALPVNGGGSRPSLLRALIGLHVNTFWLPISNSPLRSRGAFFAPGFCFLRFTHPDRR